MNLLFFDLLEAKNIFLGDSYNFLLILSTPYAAFLNFLLRLYNFLRQDHVRYVMRTLDCRVKNMS